MQVQKQASEGGKIFRSHNYVTWVCELCTLASVLKVEKSRVRASAGIKCHKSVEVTAAMLNYISREWP